MSIKEQSTASVPQRFLVTLADLPLSCPMPGKELWSAHPKVYLPIDKTGNAICPYCSAEYTLIEV